MFKKKIYLFLILFAVAFFVDDLSMRIFRLEQSNRELSWTNGRLDRIDRQMKGFTPLHATLDQINTKIQQIHPLVLKNNFKIQEVEIKFDLNDINKNPKQRLKQSRTKADDGALDTTITSYLPHQFENWGGRPHLYLGNLDGNGIHRTLMKFLEIGPGMVKKNSRLVAAVLYIRQTNQDADANDSAAINEAIDVFAVKKSWNPGTWEGCHVEKGIACWNTARFDEESWAGPGCSTPGIDYNPILMAESSDFIAGGMDDWISLRFTEAGVQQLQEWLDGQDKNNQGFILRLKNETKPQTLLSFWSSNAKDLNNRPFIQIYYVEP